MSMFWGLPMRVAAEPMFAAHASPSKKGTGFSPRREVASIKIGAMARQMMSLLKMAESSAELMMSTAKSA